MRRTVPSRSDPQQAVAEVEESLVDLEASDRITAADLEAFRNSLPTDPAAGRLVNRALPYPWGEIFEYVAPAENGRQSGYWRIAPDRSTPRSEKEARHREAFREAAREARGARGTVTSGEGEIPKSAAVIADRLSDRTSPTEESSDTGQRALQRLRTLLSDG